MAQVNFIKLFEDMIASGESRPFLTEIAKHMWFRQQCVAGSLLVRTVARELSLNQHDRGQAVLIPFVSAHGINGEGKCKFDSAVTIRIGYNEFSKSVLAEFLNAPAPLQYPIARPLEHMYFAVSAYKSELALKGKTALTFFEWLETTPPDSDYTIDKYMEAVDEIIDEVFAIQRLDDKLSRDNWFAGSSNAHVRKLLNRFYMSDTWVEMLDVSIK